MATKPKPFRTKHRDLNDNAISKMQRVRRLMISLISRHIQPHDETGAKLADEVIDLFLSALVDLEEERRIMDTGIDVRSVEQCLDELTTHSAFTDSELHKLQDLLHTLSLRQELLESRLTGLGIPVELPKLNAITRSHTTERNYDGDRQNVEQDHQH